jgi:hypothetical protein
MKKSTAIIIMVLLIAAAYFLNPTFEKHLKKTAAGQIEHTVTGDKVGPLASAKLYEYHNYYLFSTTTSILTGKRATFGMFGVVF